MLVGARIGMDQRYEQADLTSLDNFIGDCDQATWHIHAKRLGGLQVDDKLKFSRQLHGKIGRFGSLENSVHVPSRSALQVGQIDAL
jgi:hypothetical protein